MALGHVAHKLNAAQQNPARPAGLVPLGSTPCRAGGSRSGQVALGWPQGRLQKDSDDRWCETLEANGPKTAENRAIAAGQQANGLRRIVVVVVVVVVRCA